MPARSSDGPCTTREHGQKSSVADISRCIAEVTTRWTLLQPDSVHASLQVRQGMHHAHIPVYKQLNDATIRELLQIMSRSMNCQTTYMNADCVVCLTAKVTTIQ